MATRREELAEAATDYALEHGLIGLSLRPLAEALGTSDRMLLYHFADKDDLVATILRTTSARSVGTLRELPPSRDLRTAVLDLWQAVTTGSQERCQRLYVEAAALGLFGREPYATAVRATNAQWVSAVAAHFCRVGLPKAAARQATVLVDATFMGLQLDEPLDSATQLRRTVNDLADAVVARWGGASDQSGSA
ncbi:MAG TPA: TetR/AcrR family transcriptional regulator [Nocardioides sp.]|nr:TetR/AcrR family transcriptional regulator [Nocardioides sp.]